MSSPGLLLVGTVSGRVSSFAAVEAKIVVHSSLTFVRSERLEAIVAGSIEIHSSRARRIGLAIGLLSVGVVTGARLVIGRLVRLVGSSLAILLAFVVTFVDTDAESLEALEVLGLLGKVGQSILDSVLESIVEEGSERLVVPANVHGELLELSTVAGSRGSLAKLLELAKIGVCYVGIAKCIEESRAEVVEVLQDEDSVGSRAVDRVGVNPSEGFVREVGDSPGDLLCFGATSEEGYIALDIELEAGDEDVGSSLVLAIVLGWFGESLAEESGIVVGMDR